MTIARPSAQVIQFAGLNEDECRAIIAVGAGLVRQGRADAVVRRTQSDGTMFVSFDGYWGRHFAVTRERGVCTLSGLYGRVLARDRRFAVVLDHLRMRADAELPSSIATR